MNSFYRENEYIKSRVRPSSFLSLALFGFSLILPFEKGGDLLGYHAIWIGLGALIFEGGFLWNLTIPAIANVFYVSSFLPLAYRWRLALGALAFLSALPSLLFIMPYEKILIRPGIGMYLWHVSLGIIVIHYAVKTFTNRD